MNLGKSNGKPISSLFSSSFSSSVHSSCLSILSCLYFSVHRIPPPPSPHHINFSPNFFLLACTVVMFSSSFFPPFEKSTYLSYWQILGLSSIAPYFVYPLVHLQEISQNSLFRVSFQKTPLPHHPPLLTTPRLLSSSSSTSLFQRTLFWRELYQDSSSSFKN